MTDNPNISDFTTTKLTFSSKFDFAHYDFKKTNYLKVTYEMRKCAQTKKISKFCGVGYFSLPDTLPFYRN